MLAWLLLRTMLAAVIAPMLPAALGMYRCSYLRRLEVNVTCHSITFHLKFFRMGLSLNLELMDWLEQLTTEFQGSVCCSPHLPHPHAGFAGMCTMIGFYMGIGPPDSDLHTCNTNFGRKLMSPIFRHTF